MKSKYASEITRWKPAGQIGVMVSILPRHGRDLGSIPRPAKLVFSCYLTWLPLVLWQRVEFVLRERRIKNPNFYWITPN